MANPEHLAKLKEGANKWNTWRQTVRHTKLRPDLIGANLIGADLRGYDLLGADLVGAHLIGANLVGVTLSHERNVANLEDADLSGAKISGAVLRGAHLNRARMNGTDLTGASLGKASLNNCQLIGAKLNGADFKNCVLNGANLSGASLIPYKRRKADLTDAQLVAANFNEADLTGAVLLRANLSNTTLIMAKLIGANLRDANLSYARLVEANLTRADVSGCHVYGIAAWHLELTKTIQTDLVITKSGEPKVTADDLEVAQFIYLILNNARIRDAIDTLGKKAVLILGRFTAERIVILRELRSTLRALGYLPILFDFERPRTQNFLETVGTLAHLSRFVIADTTNARVVASELTHIVKLRLIPIQPILQIGKDEELATLKDLRIGNPALLKTFWYSSLDDLKGRLTRGVIQPAEKMIEAVLSERTRELKNVGFKSQ